MPPNRTPTIDVELLLRHDRPGPRYTSYPTADRFHDGVGPDEAEAALAEAATASGPVALYLHLPFCEHRCLYCACQVVITRRDDVADPYLERLKREIDLVAARLGPDRDARRPVAQLHLGGGTPTWYPPARLNDLLEHLHARFRLAPDAEAALEVDPRVTTEAHLEVCARHGFRRLSIGVQDFDPKVQRAVQREQTPAEVEALMRAARRHGYDSINLDLIHGLPYQTPGSFAVTLQEVIRLRPDRLAVYSFAHVPWVAPHQKALDADALPDARTKARLLADAREALLASGYDDVGMDHFALPGDGLAVAQREGRLHRNFMGYTERPASDLIGLGLSAIGFVQGRYLQNAKKLSAWNRAIDVGGLATVRGVRREHDDELRATVIHDWMCRLRVDKGEIERRFDVDFDRAFATELRELEPLAADGLVRIAADGLHAGPIARPFARNVAMVFDRHQRERREGTGPRYSRTV